MQNYEYLMLSLKNIIENTDDKKTKYFSVNDGYTFDINFPESNNDDTKPFELSLVHWKETEIGDVGKPVHKLFHDKTDDLYKMFMRQCTDYINNFPPQIR